MTGLENRRLLQRPRPRASPGDPFHHRDAHLDRRLVPLTARAWALNEGFAMVSAFGSRHPDPGVRFWERDGSGGRPSGAARRCHRHRHAGRLPAQTFVNRLLVTLRAWFGTKRPKGRPRGTAERSWIKHPNLAA